MSTIDSGKRVISGTFGEVWLDNEFVAENYGLQAKVAFNKEDINIPGVMAIDKKVTSMSCTGSLSMHKISSRMGNLIADKIKAGRDIRFTVTSKLADPDAYGAERIVIKNVSFDDLTLADWEHGKAGKITAPFTFTDYAFLDRVGE